MRIEIAPEIFQLFPEYIRHVLLVKNADNTQEHLELFDMLRTAQDAVRNNQDFADLKSNPFIASWRSAFEAFGVNPNQCPPSIANLIKRVRSGKDLPYINTLVCIFNIVSMRFVLPAGGDDLDKLAGDIRLGRASGEETYTPLGSAGELEHPKRGEVILYDSGTLDVLCRAWCWKNGDRSRIEESTRLVAINIDVLPPMTDAAGIDAAGETADLVRRFCGADVEIRRLSRENPFIDL